MLSNSQSGHHLRRSARHCALQFRVTVPVSQEAGARLARKIQLSISNLVDSEVGSARSVAMSVTEPTEPPRAIPHRAINAAPGCGAWWNF